MLSSKKLVLGSAILASFAIAQADTLTVDATVDEVTLYTNQADITRQATISVDTAGQHELIVANLLSDSVEDVSIHIEGAQLINQSVVVGEQLSTSDTQSAWIKVEQQANSIEKQINNNRALASALIRRLENADTDIDGVREQMATLLSEYEQLLIEQQKVDAEYDRLSQLLDWHNEGKDFKLQKALKLLINAEQAGEVQLSLRERTHKASWQPMSQWHLHTQNKQIDIIGQAKISQMTGLDWENTHITLAVMPTQYHYKPEFYEQTVTYLPGKSKEGLASESHQLLAPAVEDSYAEIGMRKSLAQPAVVFVENGGNFQVKMPNELTLASGQDSYLFTYYQEQAQADEVFSAFYSWDWSEQALLMANWHQPGEIPLLAGTMKLYRDGLFLTDRDNGNLLQPGSTWEMSFGVDARVEVETISPPEYKENNGFISRDRLVKTQQTLKMTNHGDTALPVRIYARLPISTEESIKIKPTWSPTPDEVDVDDVKGIVYWAKALAPEEVMSVEHGYEIRHPEDKAIVTSP